MSGRGATRRHQRRRRRRVLRLTLASIAAIAVAPAAAAGADRSLTTGFADHLYLQGDGSTRALWLDRTAQTGAGIVRLNPYWRTLAPSPPARPADPSSPGYDFGALDAAVKDAAARNLDVLITVFHAPVWAEGANRPSEHDAPAGTWRPDPSAFGALGQALATRYSGSFPDPSGGTLPRVRYFQAWNEPNLSTYLTPQYDGRDEASPDHYRRMLNAFYGGLKAGNAAASVVTAGTAPYGVKPGGDRMRPLIFLRKLLCLKGKGSRKLRTTECGERARLDVLSHHAISTGDSPRNSAFNPDDASTPDLGHVRRILRFAENKRTLEPGGRRPLWVTEIWWESDPPDRFEGSSLRKHARYLEEALYLIWKGGGSVAINLQIRDSRFDPQRPFLEDATGVYFFDGMPKPALTAWRFPFVTDRVSKKRIRAWGKSPASGELEIERKSKSGWEGLATARVDEGEVFVESVRHRGSGKFRATVVGASSLHWRQKG